MKKVNTLEFSVLLCKSLYILIALMAIGATVIFIHLQMDPLYYTRWNVSFLTQKGILSYSFFESWHTDHTKANSLIALDKIKVTSLYFNYLQIIGILTLIFLTVKEFLKVIESVKLIETFHQRNILSFQKMCKYLFVIFILSSITIVNAQEANLYSYSLRFTPIILSLAALIMAEIFKQGNQLLEENQLTI
ncbi:Protein of unknown function (DUF2975) [Dyadobacter jejuensis]|uniref:DUF2975 family protein n=1 Tax=Dyadobacter jejuensis TaxID=1082580 RepID=A0A316AIM1_9BACT|nr:DUF2975 domain-containing protein [Dyadobacter jejuensis]PWJ57089.1 Protein of unknown function (DUF2975) [Dyadobacter jejuensis]